MMRREVAEHHRAMPDCCADTDEGIDDVTVGVIAGPAAETAPRILVVDDEKSIREILCDFLSLEGYVVDAVADGESALVELSRRSYDIVLSDLKMPGIGGLELLETITRGNHHVLMVIMTGFGTVETAIEAMKRGAYD